MEILHSIENFCDGGIAQEINSPRTLEACLRLGLDPSELAPKSKSTYESKDLTAEMVNVKYEHFERKRNEKIFAVKTERESIIKYGSVKKVPASPGKFESSTFSDTNDKGGGGTLLEMEAKRMEALRRRQEKEISKIVEKEQSAAALQLKIKRAEDEEMKRKKQHDKKVAELKAEDDKRQAQRARELKVLEEEEAHKKREIAKKESQFEMKMKKQRQLEERRMIEEAQARDAERAGKIEENRKKTEAIIKAQEDISEENRRIMIERENRVRNQLEMSKLKKKEEVDKQHEKASGRIQEALEKHHQMQESKKLEFEQRQRDAEARAKEKAAIEQENIRKQSEDREKREKARISRLIDAFRNRKDHRESIVEKRMEKETIFQKIQNDRDFQTSMLKFNSSLKLEDKLENVERVARMKEFQRLQTLQRIENEDLRYENIVAQREEMLKKHRDEQKHSLIRKHEIGNAMEIMRCSNDFSLLDKLFSTKGKKDLSKTGGRTEEVEDENRAQTV